MITQYAAILPEGKSTPDFQCKPMPVAVKEGLFVNVMKNDEAYVFHATVESY